jgi:four helix bundle protein
MVQHGHERLDVYWLAIEHAGACWERFSVLPTGMRHLRDQMLRASTSVALNVAEGGGDYMPDEKARFYRMALRSARECSACLDILVRVRVVEPESLVELRELLGRISAMLTRLILTMKGRAVS